MKGPHNLSIQYLMSIWDAQQGRCALSNIPLTLEVNTRNINTQASLDRIDSSIGYVQGNVQFVSCALNYAKSNKSDDSIRDLIALIKEHAA